MPETRLVLFTLSLLFSIALGCMAHMILLFRFQLKHKYKHAEGLIQNQSEVEMLHKKRKYWVLIGILIKFTCFVWAILSVNTMFDSAQQVREGFNCFFGVLLFDVLLGQTLKMLVLMVIMRLFGAKCRTCIRMMLLEKIINQSYYLMVAKQNKRDLSEASQW